MEQELALSVIVPVYNVAPYLRDCLDSLISQGFSEGEYEVIVVDDGSTDDSLAIIQRYARNHSCIRCVHQSNEGVSAARNTGMAYAAGAYLAFVDGDDFLIAGALKKICDEAIRRDADMVTYEFMRLEESAQFVSVESKDEFIFLNNETGRARSTASACGSLYRRSIISENQLCFPVGMKYAEDCLFAGMVSMLIRAEKQVFCSTKVYGYRQRKNSALHTKTRDSMTRRVKDRLTAIDLWNDFLFEVEDLSEDKKQELQKRKYRLAALACLESLRSMEMDPYQVRDILKRKQVYPYPYMTDLLCPPGNAANLIMFFLNNSAVFHIIAKTGLLRGR